MLQLKTKIKAVAAKVTVKDACPGGLSTLAGSL